MENIGLLMHGFTLALSASNLLAALFGAIVGLIVGAMPGLGGITGVSLLLPLTYLSLIHIFRSSGIFSGRAGRTGTCRFRLWF